MVDRAHGLLAGDRTVGIEKNSIDLVSVGSFTVGTEGDFQFTPPAGVVSSFPFSYTVRDDAGGVSTRQVTIDVINAAIPQAGGGHATVKRGSTISIQLPIRDSDGDILQYQLLAGPGHHVGGTVLSTSGLLTYVSDPNYTPPGYDPWMSPMLMGYLDSLSFRVSDGVVWSEPATITMHVWDAPSYYADYNGDFYIENRGDPINVSGGNITPKPGSTNISFNVVPRWPNQLNNIGVDWNDLGQPINSLVIWNVMGNVSLNGGMGAYVGGVASIAAKGDLIGKLTAGDIYMTGIGGNVSDGVKSNNDIVHLIVGGNIGKVETARDLAWMSVGKQSVDEIKVGRNIGYVSLGRASGPLIQAANIGYLNVNGTSGSKIDVGGQIGGIISNPTPSAAHYYAGMYGIDWDGLQVGKDLLGDVIAGGHVKKIKVAAAIGASRIEGASFGSVEATQIGTALKATGGDIGSIRALDIVGGSLDITGTLFSFYSGWETAAGLTSKIGGAIGKISVPFGEFRGAWEAGGSITDLSSWLSLASVESLGGSISAQTVTHDSAAYIANSVLKK